MAENIRVLLTREQIEARIRQIGDRITQDYEGRDLHLVCVLKGGVFFACDLARNIRRSVSMDFLSVSSYGADTVSSGTVRLLKDLEESIEGRDVLLVEDIIDTGCTLACILELLQRRRPASLRLCTLLDKPARRQRPEITVDYVCFSIPDEFVVGYGLDYHQQYRNLPFVGVVES